MSVVRHILLVEDHTDTREAMVLLMRQQGYQVRTATTIEEAKRYCCESPYDVILCDIQLPDGSGAELPALVKADCPGARMIALTARVMPAEIAAAREAGFDQILAKPVDPDVLLEALASPH